MPRVPDPETFSMVWTFYGDHPPEVAQLAQTDTGGERGCVDERKVVEPFVVPPAGFGYAPGHG